MNIKHHLDEATLMSYAAGSLSQGMALVVACHLTMCNICSQRLRKHNAIGGALLEQIAPANIQQNALDEVLAKLNQPTNHTYTKLKQAPAKKTIADIPYPLSDYIEDEFSDLPWKKLGNSVAYYDIPCDSTGLSRLMRINPGCALLPHTHSGNELTLVLKGSFCDELGRFNVGDIADLDDEVEHQPLVDGNSPCICLVATDAPLKFSTILGKIIQPMTGF
jgi:putative transcriptional regulator